MSASSSVPAIKCAGLESAEANIEKNERKKKYISAQWKIYSRTSSGVTFLAFEHGAKLHAQLIIINAHSNCGRAQYKHGTQCDFIASHNIKKNTTMQFQMRTLRTDETRQVSFMKWCFSPGTCHKVYQLTSTMSIHYAGGFMTGVRKYIRNEHET